MLNETTAAGIRSKIADFHTQNVSAYTPSGLIGIAEYVSSIHFWLISRLPSLVGSYIFNSRCWYPLRGVFPLRYRLPTVLL